MFKYFVAGVSMVALTTGSVLAWSSDEQRAKEFFSKGLENKAERYLTEKVENALDGKVNEFEIDLTNLSEGEAYYSLLYIRPLGETENSATFFQGGLSSQDGANTINLGLARRWVMRDGNMLVGLNAFYDNEFDVGHSRASVGLEVLTSVGDLRVNSYSAISDVEENDDEDRDEVALDGTDMEIALPLPYLPNTKLTMKSFAYDGREGANDFEGTTTGLRAKLPNGFELSAGSIDYDDEANLDDDFISLSFNVTRYRNASQFGQPVLVSDNAYSLQSVVERRYEKVRRSNILTKAATNTGLRFGIGTTAASISIAGVAATP